MNEGASVAERLETILARIAGACRRSGRSGDEVVLVGASKTQPPERLLDAWAAGLRVFGENRVQEALAKSPGLPAEIDWHLIGPLQTNKVRQALDLFRTFQAIDRPKVAAALDREAGERGLTVSGLLEVNLGGEESKHGFPIDGFLETVAPLAALSHLKITGIMAIPPPGDSPEDSRPWFRKLRALLDEMVRRPEWKGIPGHLSMGMSDDFEVAIEEGATHVRVGTALFGARQTG